MKPLLGAIFFLAVKSISDDILSRVIFAFFFFFIFCATADSCVSYSDGR